MSNKERLQSEKEFHNERFSKNTRTAADKYYKTANKSRDKFRSLISADITGKKILEYGCGPGSAAFYLAKNGANVTAIDISEVAIELAQKRAKEEGLDIEFHVMDAENLDYEEDTFDLICGSGILHHLDLEASYREISRTLKPAGRAVFLEPLGHNPIINLYRRLTPKMRTDDEHPLLLNDLKLAKQFFNRIDHHHFNLIAIGASFLPFLSNGLHKIDKFLFSNFESLKKHSWIVVLNFSNPIKNKN